MIKILEIILPFFSEVLSMRKRTKKKLEKHIPYIKIIGFLAIGVLLISCWYLAQFSIKSSVLVYKQRNAISQAASYKEDLIIAHKINLELIEVVTKVGEGKLPAEYLKDSESKITKLVNDLEDDAKTVGKLKKSPGVGEAIKATGEAVKAQEAKKANKPSKAVADEPEDTPAPEQSVSVREETAKSTRQSSPKAKAAEDRREAARQRLREAAAHN